MWHPGLQKVHNLNCWTLLLFRMSHTPAASLQLLKQPNLVGSLNMGFIMSHTLAASSQLLNSQTWLAVEIYNDLADIKSGVLLNCINFTILGIFMERQRREKSIQMRFSVKNRFMCDTLYKFMFKKSNQQNYRGLQVFLKQIWPCHFYGHLTSCKVSVKNINWFTSNNHFKNRVF